MEIKTFIEKMPKVELHVHLEGSIRPDTLLALIQRNHVPLPVESEAALEHWYTFTDFAHFIDIYRFFAKCLRTPDDIEWITRQFLRNQAEQNILYSEATYTAYSQYRETGMSFDTQLAAINRARSWAEAELGVRMGIIVDISRDVTPAEGELTARWAVEGMHNGVVALGLGGDERGYPPERFTSAFAIARQAGLPAVIHAGETGGPASIRGALDALHAVRIGHGVHCLEDAALVQRLRAEQIPLEVCPTSNVCLKLYPELRQHPLPRLLEEGLYITLNSDDPPMFNTSLTREYQLAAVSFGLDQAQIEKLVMNALEASLMPAEMKAELRLGFEQAFEGLKNHG
jgi:adenosine deaminase